MSAAASASKRVLSSYLRAFRATRVAFQGDLPVLTASRGEIRENFRNPDTSKPLEARLKEMDDISTFLLRNIVQGKKMENADGKYALNIHSKTELGDNDSVKKAKKVLMDNNGGCCGGANAKI
ncbi:Mzm1 protein [Saccharomycopsis crataegensis]|uniref:Mitochondrial zinc maintenance protein 1, mitochondrial n=1 Tax=Saccharomycopsis crataegensis TaxID=43959 RepID=A0AAV5QQT9_9ASCO|nr:Mzm1 protein [Saccharomycopsis crataegensis]